MHAAKHPLTFVLFFLGMAFLVPYGMKLGLGMAGIFYAIIGAASVALLVPFSWKLLTRRLQRQGLTPGQVGTFLAGGYDEDLPHIIDAHPSRSLVQATDRRVMRSSPTWEEFSRGEAENDNFNDDDYEWVDDDLDTEDQEEDEPFWDDEEEEHPLTPPRRLVCYSDSFYRAPTTTFAPTRQPERAQGRSAQGNADLLDLAPNLKVHPDVLFSGRVLLCGLPGSGKTNTTRLLLEESAALGLPFLLIDIDGEYASLLPYLPHRLLVGKSNRLSLDASCYQSVSMHNGTAFGRWLLSQRRQVVFDVRSYTDAEGETDEDQAALVFLQIIKGMRAWEEEQENRDRIPSMIVLEEAQIWLPQVFTGSTLSVETLKELRRLLLRHARDGRRRGIGLILVAHRIAGVNKDAIMCDWSILHEPQRTDLKRYRELAPHVPAEQFYHLSRGRAVVLSPAGTVQVQFHKAKSRDQGASPGLENLRRVKEPAREEQESYDGLASSLAPLPAPSVAPVVHQEAPIPESEVVKRDTRRKAEEIDLKLATSLWNAGYNSRAKLAKALDIAENQAGKLMALLNVSPSDG